MGFLRKASASGKKGDVFDGLAKMFSFVDAGELACFTAIDDADKHDEPSKSDDLLQHNDAA